ncbi:MAG: glycerate kinase, partial [Sedimentisphaerales bacterium]|nr:glycerate kinase [Sedimentisphaerales bacterium]
EGTALVEMAKASGLELLKADQLNPLRTTTYGTGELIKEAVEYGAERILLAVGGSATVDGGVGAATALGWRFLDGGGEDISLGGGGLEHIARIVAPSSCKLPAIEVLCDVDNPLCGSEGAARVYGPQKGANRETVEQLERGLLHLAKVLRSQLGCEISELAGGGAAGGLAAGAVAFMNATIVSGIETVITWSNLRAELASADWIVTGEGCFDEQSLRGKVVSGILKAARESQTQTVVIAGQVKTTSEEYQRLGIAAAIECRTKKISLDYAMEHSRELLGGAARRFAKEYASR